MIRTARAGDAHEIADIYRPYVADSYSSFEENPPSAAEMLCRLEAGLARHPWLVSAGANGIEGFAYASAHRARAAYRWSVDVTVYVRTGLAGRGFGRALYATLLPLLGRQGFKTAFAGIALPNPASVGLHEAMGFVPVGVYRAVGFKCGTWRDVGWWSKVLVSTDTALPEPSHSARLRTSRDLGGCNKISGVVRLVGARGGDQTTGLFGAMVARTLPQPKYRFEQRGKDLVCPIPDK